MFSKIRRRITYVNVAMTLVLVFAMTGGAYAANKYVITSTKQISPKVLKALTGKPGKNGAVGATGPQGPAGSASAKGEPGTPGTAGTNGVNGTDGTNGVSVTSKEFTGAKGPTCKEGGSEFKAGSSTTYACTGKEGSPWTDGGTLPSGATETGVLANSGVPSSVGGLGHGGVSEGLVTQISFPIPLNAEPKKVNFIQNGETPPTGCSGDYEEPHAEGGYVCVFLVLVRNVEQYVPFPVGKTGVALGILPEAPGGVVNKEGMVAVGSWAVTGE
jgi:hypothetical protein